MLHLHGVEDGKLLARGDNRARCDIDCQHGGLHWRADGFIPIICFLVMSCGIHIFRDAGRKWVRNELYRCMCKFGCMRLYEAC